MSELNPNPAIAETVALLESAGASAIRVEEMKGGGRAPSWLVACSLGAGCASEKDEAFTTPQEVARHLIECSKPPELNEQSSAPEQVNESFSRETCEEHSTEQNAPELWAPEDDFGAEMLEAEAEAMPDFPSMDAAGPLVEAPDPANDPPLEAYPGVALTDRILLGDNLPTNRLIRIGQVTEHAQALIDAALADFDAAEFAELTNYVMYHTDAAGVFIGEQERYARFVGLSEADARVRLIQSVRDAMIAALREGDRAAVESFDVEAGWP